MQPDAAPATPEQSSSAGEAAPEPSPAGEGAPEPSPAGKAAPGQRAGGDRPATVPAPRPSPDPATPSVPAPRAAPATPADLVASERSGDAAPEDAPTGGLTERDQAILAFERQWWRHAGAKEQAIRDRFDLSATRYYQLLNALLDNPAALAADPVLVGRLRRLRSSRARSRRR
ncbi:Protein of unknown function [Micromonospora nigra]|uniref:DUF3263 domain-containing protein n=1 Tax=Micromonospora nigra TaxID=145857 RepID=A0A1C6RUL3_9ACTN|nr:DUF3263 domain-containing protein [Micromonospora nigra]SCL20749.1 Protein of unknown function [Micromonospora nigra]